MALVHIPSLMRDLTGGRDRVTVEGSTLREVIDGLEAAFPGIRERLLEPDGSLVGHVSVAVDGEEAVEGLRTRVGAQSEIWFLPAIAGG